MDAIYNVPWEDMDYESWTAACGLDFVKLEPLGYRKGFALHVTGSLAAIDQFSAELDYGPEAAT
jgi:hypothetical protein